MKRVHLIASLCVAAAVAVAAYGYLTRSDASPGAAPVLHGAPAAAPQIVRGEYLARAADCVACHTTPGGKSFAGGLAFKLPFGTLYSSNITADKQTGIGNWSDDDFVRALHDGVRHDGQRLYPAFPYTSYSLLSRDDALAIKAYLFSLPTVSQQTSQPDLAFPFNQRWAMGFWNAVFFKSARFTPAPDKSAEWNSGAYMAIALAHCAECHTPRNLGFALEHRNELAGAMVNGWRAPNITADPAHGIGKWSDADLYQYLRFGHAAGHGSAAGPMGEAVENSLQFLAPKDIQALITYLRSIPPRSGDQTATVNVRPDTLATSTAYTPAANTPADLQTGLKLFEGSCASCHQWNGQGPQSEHAALLGARSVNDPSGQNIVQVLLHGEKMRIAGKDVVMPSFGAALSDAEMAQLSNYVIFQFGGKQGKVTPAMVMAQRKN
ncbi:c-type cytochrome [Pseudoduganella sp. FT25W]|uniref:C-type cytochrome n=1 Tax=Duganella alba TaxID=2666081 RepID=A0A6L5QMP4_9BURK|nr:c-type cytochrome [Duganella alba]MRX10947.1 c-type cytochrome [Duganella alba]MRX19069.1 c-type cytochrome [Duganella alba]